ncbi:hypothetical protein BpHYR1_024605 [Brachionus plicatilis]|uniref:Uncharacterized protein n=1 Tax=Brachionus plicatilis TaxID=10195 RepID=A0A3M7SQT4_BRAPC|nr:hypothetical protein BpHYR1_024605 [Brachionus plicatilis]
MVRGYNRNMNFIEAIMFVKASNCNERSNKDFNSSNFWSFVLYKPNMVLLFFEQQLLHHLLKNSHAKLKKNDIQHPSRRFIIFKLWIEKKYEFAEEPNYESKNWRSFAEYFLEIKKQPTFKEKNLIPHLHTKKNT